MAFAPVDKRNSTTHQGLATRSSIDDAPEPSAPLSVPRTFGRYRLARLLATGGMAQIYLAQLFGAEGFVKPLVIKRLDPWLAQRTYFTNLFINEAKLLSTLTHGNIVPVFDFGRVDDDLYIAMEYIAGSSLGRVLVALIEQDRQLDADLAAHIALEICRGLDYAHRKQDGQGRPAGIIHRDIKPSNIIISDEGEVKIVDFGVAKLAGRLEKGRKHDHLAGTLAYMAPEQALRKPVDVRTDIFATGLVLHEMLNGRRLRNGESPSAVLRQAQESHVVPLPQAIPEQLRAIATKATEPDPADRYADAHAMEQALSAYLVAARQPDVAPPRKRLAELLLQLPLERVEVPSSPPEDPHDKTRTLNNPLGTGLPPKSSAVDLPAEFHPEAPPDLDLIRGAAETFHSEFLTRVLMLQPAEARRRSASWRRGTAVILAVLALAGGLAYLLWPGKPSTTPAARAGFGSGPRNTRQTDVDKAPTAAGAANTTRTAVDGGHAKPMEGSGIRHAPRRPRGFGYLNLNAVPWARVIIDGRRMRKPTPLLKLKLRAGWHKITLINREHRLRQTIRVRISPGKTAWKVVNLR